MCTASLTFSNSTFCQHSVFMCFVWISEQTAIISLYSINWLVCITETECVYCAVRTGSLYIIQWLPISYPQPRCAAPFASAPLKIYFKSYTNRSLPKATTIKSHCSTPQTQNSSQILILLPTARCTSCYFIFTPSKRCTMLPGYLQ